MSDPRLPGNRDAQRELMLRYLDDDLQPHELAQLHLALRNDPELRREMADLLVQTVHLNELGAESRKSGRLAGTVMADERVSGRRVRAPKRRGQPSILPQAAAAACVLLVAGFLLLSSGGTRPPAPKPVVKQPLVNRAREELDARLAAAAEEQLRAATRLAELERKQARMKANVPGDAPQAAEREQDAAMLALEAQRQAVEAELRMARERRATVEREMANSETTPVPIITPAEVIPPPTVVEAQPIGRVLQSRSDVVCVRTTGGTVMREKLTAGDRVFPGDVLQVSGNAKNPGTTVQLALSLFSGATLDLAEGAELELKNGSAVTLKQGRLYADVEKGTSRAAPAKDFVFSIATPLATVGVAGTQFDLAVTEGLATVQMEEGRVTFFNAQGTRNVDANQSAQCRAGQPPAAPQPLDPRKLWRGRKGPLASTVGPVPARMEVVSMALVNTATSEVVPGFDPMPADAVLDMAKLSAEKITFLIRTRPERVGSLKIELDGVQNKTPENAPPYAVFGDDFKGKYHGWKPGPGKHSIVVTPYSGKDLTGEAGPAFTLNFRVIDKK